MRRGLVVMTLLAAATAIRAEDPPAASPSPSAREPSYWEAGEPTGQPSRIVAPDYPLVALLEKRGGVVEITARVSPFGLLEDAKVTAVPPTDEVFAAAVRDVLGDWIFQVPTDKDCQPDPRPVTSRVEFSAEDGKPHIAVLRPASPKVESKPHYKALYRAEPKFPYRALNEGIAGTVFARIDVNGTGEVSDVKGHAYSVRHAPAVLKSLEDETRRALRQWRYPPPPGGEPWAGCYTIHFRFR